MAETNIAQQAFSALLKASKAKQKPDSPPSSVNYVVDLANRRITGTFIFTFEEIVNEETGEIVLRIANSLTQENAEEAQGQDTPTT